MESDRHSNESESELSDTWATSSSSTSTTSSSSLYTPPSSPEPCSSPETPSSPLMPSRSPSIPPFAVGDVVMARLAGYFYWPGIVSCDPEKFVHQKYDMVHVSFLDEPPSRGWVPVSFARPFESPAAAERLLDLTDVETACTRSNMDPSTYAAWFQFVAAAAEAVKLEPGDRIERFLELQEFSPATSEDEAEKGKMMPQTAKSCFPIGTVVLAKMRGYPHWPAIVSPDPLRRTHVVSRSIHVHFLDRPVTRGWGSIDSLKFFQGHSLEVLDLVDASFKTDARLKSAIKLAKEALKMPTVERVDRFLLEDIGHGRDDVQFEAVRRRIRKEEDWNGELEE